MMSIIQLDIIKLDSLNNRILAKGKRKMKISLVVPVYNEESAIPLFYKAIDETLKELN